MAGVLNLNLDIDSQSVLPMERVGELGLTADRRGIIVAPRVVRPKLPYFVLREPVPPNIQEFSIERAVENSALSFASTYWDDLVLPVQRGIFFQSHSRGSKALWENGILRLVGYQTGGVILEMTNDQQGRFVQRGDPNQQLIDAHVQIASRLRCVSRGRWTLSNNVRELSSSAFAGQFPAIKFSLIGAIPIVSNITDWDKFLRWREDRSTERRRLLDELSRLSTELDKAENSGAFLSAIVSEIQKTSADISVVASERGFRVNLGSYDFTFSPRDVDFWAHLDGAAGWGFGISEVFNSPVLGAIAASTRLAAPMFRFEKSNVRADAVSVAAGPFLAFGEVAYRE